jgi:hypothetical protein
MFLGAKPVHFPLALQASHDFLIKPEDFSIARNRDQLHIAALARLKPDSGACSYVQTHPMSGVTVKIERDIGLRKVIMAADLHGTIPGVRNRQRDRLTVGIQDMFALSREQLARDHA